MEDSSTRAINFAVALIVTLIIVSLVVTSFSKVKEIYSLTKNTDNAIHSGFDNIYEIYDGKELNGMGLLNTVKKFEEDNEIVSEVRYPSSNIVKGRVGSDGRESTLLKQYMQDNEYVYGHRYSFERMYKVEVKEENGKIIINFKV
ncbi:MAG: hypothetical protein IKL68_00455 [Clostridia bacterium]|nr:hypothetical protein [Clostridia bacterium]